MEEKVFDVGLEEIWRKIETDTLSKDFVIFDNLDEYIEVMELLDIPVYPMRISLNMIILCTEGHLKLKIGVQEYLLSESKLVTILTGHIFQILEISPDFKAGFLLLKDEYLLEQNDIRNIIFNIAKALTWKPCYELPKEIMQEETFLFRSIRNMIRQKENKFRLEIIHHYFRVMLYHVCNVFFEEQEKNVDAINRQDEIFYRFIRDVSIDFYQHRMIKYYAEKASLTPKYFAKIILDVSGKKANDWIDEYVILEAKTLLKNTSMTIQEISDRLNFSNQSHFSRYFNSHTGVSPNTYKRQ